jgi:murein DD-endopeptidase MepM/ murein hydrolase activator NlpD
MFAFGALGTFGMINFISYTVQSGDTLSAIADRFGADIDAIAGQNNIADPNLIEVGQQLDIPVEDAEFDAYYAQMDKTPSSDQLVATAKASTPKIATVPTIPSAPVTVSMSTLPAFLQGTLFGFPKIYVYPVLAAVGIIILIPIIKRKRVKPVKLQPA